MVDPVVAAAGISAASSLLGGVLGSRGQARANAQNAALQREFAQNGIRWRVEDAKAAGLHPLYALGGSGATYTPSAQNVMAPMASALDNMGQNVGRAAMAQATEEEREQRQLQTQLLRSQIAKTDVEAQAIASESQRQWLQTWQSKPLNFDGTGLLVPGGLSMLSGDARVYRGAGGAAQDAMTRATVKPDERTASFPGDSSRSASAHPLWKEYYYGPDGDQRVLIPGDEPTEALESPLLWPSMLSRNLQTYGPSFITSAIRDFFGMKRRYQQVGPGHSSYRWQGSKRQVFGRGSPR